MVCCYLLNSVLIKICFCFLSLPSRDKDACLLILCINVFFLESTGSVSNNELILVTKWRSVNLVLSPTVLA